MPGLDMYNFPDEDFCIARELTKTHEVLNFALFDQFAYTNHIETGVILKKIK